ncbi:MAG: TIGR00730 family Rossman fold protein [Actinobacteria bacterium QS_8_72_14]|jgi:uncharacterized protein (TIGR00730 family)|nr:MAG: TIGR00730 family Rossman fold protein [Actinobacteria bacterium QS_8_72_14]
MTEIRAVCVFCASSEGAAARDRKLAHELGTAIAERGWRLVYGGGDVGLMGEVAHAALAAAGGVTGVIPRKLVTHELALREVDELVVTESMRERQRIMDERSDAFVVLPGGLGTLAELLEMLTLAQLGYHDRPVVLLDPDGFWQPLRHQLEAAAARGLANSQPEALTAPADSVVAALARLAS